MSTLANLDRKQESLLADFAPQELDLLDMLSFQAEILQQTPNAAVKGNHGEQKIALIPRLPEERLTL